MKKEEIKRKDLRCSLLKRVILRADISALMKLEDAISNLSQQEWFRGIFESMEKFYTEASSNFADRTSPVADSQGVEVRRFIDCKLEPKQELFLDISDEFICMDISCNDKYESLDPYMLLIAKVIGQFIHDNDYVKIKRLAIRKIDGLILANANEANKVFEYFNQGIMAEGESMRKRLYNDYFYSKKKKVNVNYSRQVKIGDKESNRFIFTLDTDVFVKQKDLDNLRPNTDELKEIFSDRLNEIAFDVFKRGVKEEFLNEYLRK